MQALKKTFVVGHDVKSVNFKCIACIQTCLLFYCIYAWINYWLLWYLQALETHWMQGMMLHPILNDSLCELKNLHSVWLHICLHFFLLYYNNCRNLNNIGCKELYCIQYWHKFICIQYLHSYRLHICLQYFWFIMIIAGTCIQFCCMYACILCCCCKIALLLRHQCCIQYL